MWKDANLRTVDYNSWVESEKARKLTKKLDKDIVLAEGESHVPTHHTPVEKLLTVDRLGYKQYDTGRTYMARMGDWRENKDVEMELDGIGGVNILVKADVHRSGSSERDSLWKAVTDGDSFCRYQLSMLRLRESGRDRGLRQDGQKGRIQGLGPAKLRGVAHRHRRETRERLGS